MTATMRAWQVANYGSLDQLTMQTVDRPVVQPGHALVRVAHAGLNFADMISVEGRYQTRSAPPFLLGAELSGVVVDTGEGCDTPIGARVMAQVPSGAYAEYCLVDCRRLTVLDPSVDLAVAAAVPVSYTTATVALFRIGRLQAGDAILIHAAAGAAGLAAVRLAKDAGARVVAAASSAEKRELAAAAGADQVIDNRDPEWGRRIMEMEPRGVDLVYDPVGGDVTLQSLRVLAWGGRILLVGFAGGASAAIPANQLLVRSASACGVFWSFDADPDGIAAIQHGLATSLADKRIVPDIGSRIPFASLKDGLLALTGGRTTGKLVLDVKAE